HPHRACLPHRACTMSRSLVQGDRPACRALPEVTKAPTPRGPATPRAVSAARCGCALAPHAPACTARPGESLGAPPLSRQAFLHPRQLVMPPPWPHPVQSPGGLQVTRREKNAMKILIHVAAQRGKIPQGAEIPRGSNTATEPVSSTFL